MHVCAYLRASTDEQDANRAKADLIRFADEHGLKIATFYAEHESGAKLKRPELFRLVSECHPGDVLLCEQVDRLSRLDEADWLKLRTEIDAKQVRIVALDLPTFVKPSDEFISRMFTAINDMMLDMLAAIARKDYEDRRRRQKQGIAKAKANGIYKGKQEDVRRNKAMADMLAKGMSYSQVQAATGASRATVAKIAKRLHEQA